MATAPPASRARWWRQRASTAPCCERAVRVRVDRLWHRAAPRGDRNPTPAHLNVAALQHRPELDAAADCVVDPGTLLAGHHAPWSCPGWEGGGATWEPNVDR